MKTFMFTILMLLCFPLWCLGVILGQLGGSILIGIKKGYGWL